MDVHQIALIAAGAIGSGVAIIHGVLTQRLMIGPILELRTPQFSSRIRVLIATLLHFSTFNWLLGGVMLAMAALSFDHQGKLATGILVASSYAFGAVGNLWATRGWHPGWILYGITLVLILYGLWEP
jgi:hypothetical protein